MLTLPIKKKWFDMILSGKRKRNIGKSSRITKQDLPKWRKTGVADWLKSEV